jgi:hypothetical protein
MSDHKPEAIDQKSLTNDEIVTGRKVARRAFLSATGLLLAGGAALMVAGARGAAQDAAQGQAKASDPDSKKKKSTKTKTKKTKSTKESDPDKAKSPSQ